MSKDREFTYKELYEKLENAIGKTLGEVDAKNIFDSTIKNPKITGIAGDVIEQSVLGCKPNNDPNADILVEGERIELKTTGLRYLKDKNHTLVPKEPISITGVSPKIIVHEKFNNSRFWNKIRKTLFVYYLYASPKTVISSEYANFYIKGYDIHTFNDYDVNILKNDWETVRDFIIYLQEQPNFVEDDYARLSHDLRDKLMYIDTAPKWPNPPRFRFKRKFAKSIVNDCFSKNRINNPIDGIYSYDELDMLCKKKTTEFKGKTVKELAKYYGLTINYNEKGIPSKSICESISVRMIGGRGSKINSLDIFKKAGVKGKTIVMSPTGGRTEDTKLFTIDFDLINKNALFEESDFYDYFCNNQLLCIIFKEKKKGSLLDSEFLGFKRLVFDDAFINEKVKLVFNKVKDLVINNKIVESICYDKNHNPIRNPNGEIRKELNFPKSSDNNVLFLRGTGIDSSPKHKTLLLNNIKMYQQQVWIKGVDIIKLLSKVKYC